jgi:hypothetical protein
VRFRAPPRFTWYIQFYRASRSSKLDDLRYPTLIPQVRTLSKGDASMTISDQYCFGVQGLYHGQDVWACCASVRDHCLFSNTPGAPVAALPPSGSSAFSRASLRDKLGATPSTREVHGECCGVQDQAGLSLIVVRVCLCTSLFVAAGMLQMSLTLSAGKTAKNSIWS